MQLCAITDRKRIAPATPAAVAEDDVLHPELRSLVGGWIEGGVNFIQLREKDLDAAQLRRLAGEILTGIDRRRSKLLVNFPVSSAGLKELATVADGVHIPGRPASAAAEIVRQSFRAAGREAIVSMSCHTLEDVRMARSEGADFVLFAPVFEKFAPGGEKFAPGGEKFASGGEELAQVGAIPSADAFRPRSAGSPSQGLGQGLTGLGSACDAAGDMPVFALGGVTAENALQCFAAGAAGVAGIRLFLGGGWRRLRAPSLRSKGARSIYS